MAFTCQKKKSLEPLDSEYSYAEMRESLLKNDVNNYIQMKQQLLAMGIPEEEAERATIEYFTNPTPEAKPWPPDVIGLDLLPQAPIPQIPDTGFPPVFQANIPGNKQPYPTPDQSPYGIGTSEFVSMPSPMLDISYTPTADSANWLGLAADPNSQPPTLNVPGFNFDKAVPEWRYDIEDSQGGVPYGPAIAIPPSDGFPLHEVEPEEEKKKKKSWLEKLAPWLALIGGLAGAQHFLEQPKLQLMARYVYHGHERPEICESFHGQTFDLLNTANRPVLPSEGLGYTTQHPNCECTWKIIKEFAKPKKINKSQKKHIQHVRRHIGQAARHGTLHSVNPDGSLSQKTRHSNPLREAILEIRNQFGWLTEDYLTSARKLANEQGGHLYLVKAAEESITDHRTEGEPLRRKLSGDELSKMARTAINKDMDINHNPSYRTGATIIDSEYEPTLRQIQMVVLERDPDIIKAINTGAISAVSINGGSPRDETLEPCDEHCVSNCELCMVPKGVVLGELDNIGMTWVVTDPRGIFWKGIPIAPASPGVKTTAIQPL